MIAIPDLLLTWNSSNPPRPRWKAPSLLRKAQQFIHWWAMCEGTCWRCLAVWPLRNCSLIPHFALDSHLDSACSPPSPCSQSRHVESFLFLVEGLGGGLRPDIIMKLWILSFFLGKTQCFHVILCYFQCFNFVWRTLPRLHGCRGTAVFLRGRGISFVFLWCDGSGMRSEGEVPQLYLRRGHRCFTIFKESPATGDVFPCLSRDVGWRAERLWVFCPPQLTLNWDLCCLCLWRLLCDSRNSLRGRFTTGRRETLLKDACCHPMNFPFSWFMNPWSGDQG